MDTNDYERNFLFPKPPGSIIPHILLFMVQICALSAPIFPGRKILFTTTIIILAVVSNFSPFTSDAGLAQFFSLAWPHYLSVLQKIIFAPYPGPEVTLWRIDRPAREALNFMPFGISKLVWAFIIWFNLRGIRWNFQVKNIPEGPRPNQGRWSFVAGRVLTFIRLIIMGDFLSRLAIQNFYTAPDGVVGTMNSRYLTTRHPNLMCRVYRTATVGMIPYTFMNLQYVGGAIVWVLLGISKPVDWPPFFGRLSQVTTVRAFWGKYWHQMLRHTVNAYTGAFVDALHLRRGTLRTYTQLWLSFAISGIMHSAAIYLIPSPLNITFRERSLGFFQFFMLQATAITFEDFVQYIYKNLVSNLPQRPWQRWLGHLWVIFWFAFSLPYFLDIMLKLKSMEKPMLPFTIMKPLVPYASICSNIEAA
ncbi:hypothetical protein LOZ53_003085 [Ophidiomyces ophidiicola]|uniref:Uncharacterized protein n=1 Tax=Ophidiomyces ophidiicola TaxID=1387563 RepID=A0ACB8V3A2_9EURO|nr:uncharacterized protein LOZ57_005245 [Ophidiomyces ophidiicola]KAI1912870.1 hypothetical protein LOZ61_003074 [Ophidiomyces ophidiicola]KAI1917585.1 hypothetical protein LOZ64_003065 [Ophidiomyces ophidiicola]KAI1930741.1 hypothetical protein LOZ60_000717 [Ophidiomyces ophidiicola]KAI1942948.1 hypothetical protein LOZ57_005245 [Ophidiomyces ophidiicola]KAI1962248.1 hypothetical protein LOZ59_002078 [Ophidiomyces ophidiicola]